MKVTQDNVFEIAHKVMAHSSYRNTGHLNPKELAQRFTDQEAIEAYILEYGGSQVAYDYNYWRFAIPNIVEVYGERLRPYCEERIKNPFHSGGTAYGKEYLERSRNHCRLFCELVIQALDDLKRREVIYDDALIPEWEDQ